MKISYITMQFPVPSETFASIDVESLRHQGQDISVYCMRPKHSEYNKLMLERNHSNLQVKHFSLSSVLSFLFFLLFHPLISASLLYWVFLCNLKSPKHLFKSLVLFPSAISIFSALFKHKPDIVHLFWGHYPSMVGYLVKKFIPNTVMSMFLGAHDLLSKYPGSISLSTDADVVFTHSKSNLAIMTEMGIDVAKVNVIVRGTKLDFPVKSNPDKFKSIDAPVFLTAARLIEEKGVDDVIKLFNGVSKMHPSAVLYIAGDGPYKRKLVEMVESYGLEKNIVFLGYINQLELIDHMAKSHFFVLMSRYPSERLPNVVKEAMYQKCVVITTETSGIDELIEDKKEGFIVDYNAAADVIKASLSDGEGAKTMADLGHSKIINDFDVNVSMRRYLQLWQKSVSRKTP